MPPMFYTNWTYEIWLKGPWANVEGLNGCIDGTVCHSPPPEIKKHSAVVSSIPLDSQLPVGTAVDYNCDIKCEYK